MIVTEKIYLISNAATESTYLHYVKMQTKITCMYIATYVSMFNGYLVGSEHLELYSLSCLPRYVSIPMFNKGKIPQHILRYLRIRFYL